ncbi:MAG: PTS sugar transporter subunit IIA, partial [Gammaproteobacteria bacterium]|nr:PTS sugar transporter subunit IIA [Gammaproteobacteria bacterium]
MSAQPAPDAPQAEVALGDFLDDARVVIDLDVASRKRLFERMAKLAASRGDGPGLDSVLSALTQREKLGSTGIGNGIALPHGRMDGFAEPLIAVARLKRAIHYDAPDGAPVWLAARSADRAPSNSSSQAPRAPPSPPVLLHAHP